MGTIPSHTSTTIKKGKKTGIKGVILKAQTPPKAARCPCRVTAEVTLCLNLNLTSEDVCRLCKYINGVALIACSVSMEV